MNTFGEPGGGGGPGGGAINLAQQRHGSVLIDPTKLTLAASSPLRDNQLFSSSINNKDGGGGSFMSKMVKIKSSKSFKALHQENTEKQQNIV